MTKVEQKVAAMFIAIVAFSLIIAMLGSWNKGENVTTFSGKGKRWVCQDCSKNRKTIRRK
jgi:hypothetical protein